MAISSKLFPALLLLLLLATEMGHLQEAAAAAATCQGRCEKCTGSCFDDDECSINCRNERYETGICTGKDYHCECSKSC